MEKLSNANTKQLWQAVKGKRDSGHDNICSNIGSVDDFNDYFAGISTDHEYDPNQIVEMKLPSHSGCAKMSSFYTTTTL
jgi:hypothetical protein